MVDSYGVRTISFCGTKSGGLLGRGWDAGVFETIYQWISWRKGPPLSSCSYGFTASPPLPLYTLACRPASLLVHVYIPLAIVWWCSESMVAKETEAWGGEEVGGIVGLVTSKKIKLGSFFAFGLMVPVPPETEGGQIDRRLQK